LIPNPDQGDIDHDGVGDICDETDVEGALVLGNGKVVSRFSGSGEGTGKIIMRGALFDHPPFDGFVTGLLEGLDPNSDGPDEGVILVRVMDEAVLGVVAVFVRSECDVRFKEGFGEDFLWRVKCKNADRTQKLSLKKHPLGRDMFRFALTLKKLEIEPFLMERVTVILTSGAFDRPDEIGDLVPCEVKTNRAGEAVRNKCREPALGF
jgi:hypothetical protein